jgi:hypothetical protein
MNQSLRFSAAVSVVWMLRQIDRKEKCNKKTNNGPMVAGQCDWVMSQS